jgi:uncharacterized membrane protein YvbJ
MYCPKCGAQNDDSAFHCIQCGHALRGAASPGTAGTTPRSVPSYLAQAIIVTLLCCLPFGIVAIVYAAQVNGKVAAGDYAGAVEASNKAKTWCWVSFGVGLAAIAIWALFLLLAGLSDL